MITQRTIRRTLLALALVALGATGTALADTLVSVQNAQIIDNGGAPSEDVYSFVVDANDDITVDIDTGMFSDLDTVLKIVDPDGLQSVDLNIVQNDPNSTNQLGLDAYAQFKAVKPGTWQVSVSAVQGGGFGFYNLLVTRVPAPKPQEPEPLTITIDIKPNNPHNATPIRMGERHIRVALMSDRKLAFDPFAIDVKSLRFGPTGTESSFVRCAKRGKDRNGDRKPDRVCRFDIGKTGFTLTNSVGMVKGMTRDGKAFQGQADVKVLAKHKGHHNDRNRHDDDDDD